MVGANETFTVNDNQCLGSSEGSIGGKVVVKVTYKDINQAVQKANLKE